MNTLAFLGNLAVPLILIIVGYGIQINQTGLGKALMVVAIRLSMLIPSALLVNHFLIREFLQLESLFETALFTLLILPPPFILPLYTRANLDPEEKQYINNVLVLHTIFSILIFLIYFAMNP